MNNLSLAQEDTTYVEEEFDFSDFVLTEEPAKSFASNKIIGQSPTPLISVYYDFQAENTLTPGSIQGEPTNESTISANHGFGILGNFPILSRNNILINLGVEYNEQHYVFANQNDGVIIDPLTQNLEASPLRRTVLQATIFKPLNEKRFLLGFIGGSLNGDYDFGNYDFSKVRVPVAAIYGFKPTDKLMWGVGAVRTYLGGALNYLPVVYYYHTFKNPKWGVEAVLPSRLSVRYKPNNKTIINTGFTVTGATYHLSKFRDFERDYLLANGLIQESTEDDIELRRSELRIGVGVQRALSDFIWMNFQVGARLNWQYNIDEGDFFRGFDSDDYYMENELSTPVFARLYISFVSP